MKLQACGVMITVMLAGSMIADTMHELEMLSYRNQLKSVESLVGATTCTLVFHCEHPNPIVTYVPSNFAQSQCNDIHRYLLPNTTVAQDLQSDVAHVTQFGSHVEILLHGRLMMQTAGDFMVVFMVQSTNS